MGAMAAKDSSFDLNYISLLCQIKKSHCPSAEWHVTKVVRMGGDGGVVGGSNIFPKAFVSFYRGAVMGNEAMENAAFH